MSQGAALRGRLYATPEKPQPTVVMAHGFSETITMVADKYAEVFARAGFAVLLYDHALRGGDISCGGISYGPMPVVSFNQLGPPPLLTPLTAFRWFIEYGAVHGTGWKNVATYVVPNTPAPFSVGLVAPHLRVPSLWVMCPTDEMPEANPAVARRAYDSAKGKEKLFEIDGGHFGLMYWPSHLFDLAG